MAIKLHKEGFDHAKAVIENGLEVEHSSNWDAVKPTKDEEVRHLNTHTLDEYGIWFLGIDTEVPENDKSKFVYPHGDLKVVHKSALIIAEEQAREKGHKDIQKAAQELIELIDRKAQK